MNPLAIVCKLLIHNIQQLATSHTVCHLQHRISLGQHAVILNQRSHILSIELRDKAIQPAAAFLGGIVNQKYILRRHDNHRHKAHVVGQSLILLACSAHALIAAALLIGADNLLSTTLIRQVVARKHKELGVHIFVQRPGVGAAQRALAHREVIDRVQHIGLARTIDTNKAVQSLREFHLGIADILIIKYR